MKSEIPVSVAFITYNQALFVEESLRSVLTQTKPGIEVIVSDDKSTDDTLNIILKLASFDSRIQCLSTEKNLGVNGNWDKVIKACQGDYVAIIEGDDYWISDDKIQMQINLLENDPKAVACFSNAKILTANSTISEYHYVDKFCHDLNPEEFFSLNQNPIPTCTTVFRRSAFDGFPSGYYQSPFADWILHSVLMMKGHYLFLNETTSVYRQHPAGVWTGITKEKQLLNKLKALRIIRKIVGPRYSDENRNAIMKQLDELLTFYREQGNTLKFILTWIKLKLA